MNFRVEKEGSKYEREIYAEGKGKEECKDDQLSETKKRSLKYHF